MRFFIELAYRGTAYHGWQVQPNAHSVQAELNRVLQILVKHPVETVGSGRTDTGVHAIQQFAHTDTHYALAEPVTVRQLNALLPPDIAVKHIYPVADNAHARYDAIARRYEYRISPTKNPFLTNLCYYYKRTLDVALMNQAAQQLLGEHDFTSFSRVKTDVTHFRCTVYEAGWQMDSDLVIFRIRANRFLRGMVRAIVGTLLDVGTHGILVDDFARIIERRDRTCAGSAAPPEGLFLTRVEYPSGLLVS